MGLTTALKSVEQLEADVAWVVRMCGQHVHFPLKHPASGDTAEKPGGVIIARDGAGVTLNWRTRTAHGRSEGNAARAAATAAGRLFLRQILEIHAPMHGWIVAPEHDRAAYSPVRVRWVENEPHEHRAGAVA